MTTFAPGDFSFLEDDDDVMRCKNAYEAVTQENMWDFFKTQTVPLRSGFVHWEGTDLARLKPHLDKVSHTAHSYVETLRTILHIAKVGWEGYTDKYVKAIEARKVREEEMARRRAAGGYIPAHWRTAAD